MRKGKLEEYENENYYLLWWSETAYVLSPKMAGIGVFYEQIVNEAQPSWLSLVENEGE